MEVMMQSSKQLLSKDVGTGPWLEDGQLFCHESQRGHGIESEAMVAAGVSASVQPTDTLLAVPQTRSPASGSLNTGSRG